MNKSEIQCLVNQKESELKAKKDFATHVFNLIKDDCVDLLIKKSIECNFNDMVWLYCRDIMKIAIEKLGLGFDEYVIKDSWLNGIEKAWIHIDPYAAFPKLHFDENNIPRIDYRSDEIKEAEKFAESIDYPHLLKLLMSYILSKGFKTETATLISTGKRITVMRFTTTKSRLTGRISDKKVEIGTSHTFWVSVVIIVCIILYFLSSYLHFSQ